MALIKWTGQPEVWEPFRELASLEAEIDRFLGRELPRWGKGNGKAWWPEVDIAEEKDRILIKVDLPGMKQEEIDVEAAGGVLTIKGERKQEAETKEGKLYRSERSYGSFLRSFSLPASVDASKVSASYKGGVLEVALPKREEAKAKTVKVDVK